MKRTRQIDTPKIKQDRKLDCGIAALRMVSRYFGKDISAKEIIKKVGGIKKFGVRAIELADFAKNIGFKVECYSFNKKLARGKAKIKPPEKADILKFLNKKIPVIIAVRSWILYNKRPSKMGHFIVITDHKDGKFSYNDPKDGKKHQINEEKLMFAWHAHIEDSSAYLLAIKAKKRKK
ncbi:MAG: C39 family peptidase [Candidatus Diapherotrites archaeon]|uniref:C39 family peptidase n=1 Tax=Candidatus Iainarchaeum sp. TaxID=3101447 RepID=A0A939C4A3_9ARCH|nr:C39 family peptidase [Candidatus Diapherotrites archaeon]